MNRPQRVVSAYGRHRLRRGTGLSNGGWIGWERIRVSSLLPETTVKKILISSELLAIAKGIKEYPVNYDENDEIRIRFTPASMMFERGRMYDLYSARRNDRLKRKLGEVGDDVVCENPAAAVELGKRRSQKKVESSVRKSVPADFSVGRVGMMSKEMKKSARTTSVVRASADFGILSYRV